jgi:prevent-host-death family protein
MNRSSSNTVGAFEAKTHFSEILDKVEAGEEITITRHGTPVARMVPVKKRSSEAERRTAIEQIKQLSQGLSLRGLKIRELIEEGRR